MNKNHLRVKNTIDTLIKERKHDGTPERNRCGAKRNQDGLIFCFDK